MIFFSLLFIGLGIYVFSLSRVSKRWVMTKGQVVGYKQVGFRPMRNSIVEYEVLGRRYRVINPVSFEQFISGSLISRTSLGDEDPIGYEFEVAYDQNQPKRAKVVGKRIVNTLVFIAVLLIIIGLCAATNSLGLW